MLMTTVPGLARVAVRELNGLGGFHVRGSGFDGRSDIVLFDAVRPAGREPLDLRLAEDLFVEVGRTFRSEGDEPRWIAGRIWRPGRAASALSVWAETVRPIEATMTFR